MKLTVAQKEEYKQYILKCIEEDFNGNELTTPVAKVKFIYERFISEVGWNIDRVGEMRAMVDWLADLALDIPFTYADITQLARHINCRTYTDKEEEKICENYFPFMANLILQMFKTYKVK